MFRKVLKYVTIGLFAFTALIVAIGVMFPLSPEEKAARDAEKAAEREVRQAEREARTCEDGVMAEIMSRRFVEQRLRAPASAEFPGNARITYLGDCRHEIASAVDAQNAFGAMLRTPYIAVMKYSGNDYWVAERLELIE